MGDFLTPVLALVVWTLIMAIWMYKRRIPAMMAITKNTQDFIDNPKLKDEIPLFARQTADNYNHLHESPVIFYALMLYLFAMGQGDQFYLYLAWAYVAIRVLHSLVQVTTNKVMLRFPLFALSLVVLVIMAARATAALF